MNYQQRLKAAAKIILDGDSIGASVDTEGLGITATLKPHQVEGVSWLIRRYSLGVNVILGDEVLFSSNDLSAPSISVSLDMLLALMKFLPIITFGWK
ncbi:hypothetical protein Dimus_005857 [Dionaea muscipula]